MTPPATGRKTKREPRRRQEIIRAATRVFHDKGYDSSSIQDIADEVGLLKGSLYHYINSKEDLLFAVMEEVHDGLVDNWRAQDVDGSDPVEAIRQFVRAHVVFTTANLTQIRVFLHDFDALSKHRRRSITTKRDEYEGVLREYLVQARAAGAIPADVDCKLASFTIFGTMNWLYQWYRPGGGWPAESVADFIADFCVRALCGERAALPAAGATSS